MPRLRAGKAASAGAERSRGARPSGVRVWFRPDRARLAVLRRELRRMLAILRNTPGVRRVILIGSLAGGNVGVASDIDLIVVREDARRFLDRTADLLRRFRPRTALDLLVYTPAEFDRMLAEGRPFLRHALAHGKVLLERGSPR